jgi:hypothetical protein
MFYSKIFSWQHLFLTFLDFFGTDWHLIRGFLPLNGVDNGVSWDRYKGSSGVKGNNGLRR